MCIGSDNSVFAGTHCEGDCTYVIFAAWCPSAISHHLNFHSTIFLGSWVLAFGTISLCCGLQWKQRYAEIYQDTRVLWG